MIIDIIVVVLLLWAVIRGYQRGLIVAVFSVVAFIIGLAAALKLSAVVAGYVGHTVKVSDKWLPVIAFAVVFIAVVLLIRWGANLVQKGVEIALLGWVNRLGGILLFCCIYILVFSVIIFYAEQLDLLKPETKKTSVSYAYIQPWGPVVIDSFGKLIPVFKNMFADLQEFFEGVSRQIPPSD